MRNDKIQRNTTELNWSTIKQYSPMFVLRRWNIVTNSHWYPVTDDLIVIKARLDRGKHVLEKSVADKRERKRLKRVKRDEERV